MKVKVELSPNVSKDEAEERLYKALRSKINGLQTSEKYDDPILNEFLDLLLKDHQSLLQNIQSVIDSELRTTLSKKP